METTIASGKNRDGQPWKVSRYDFASENVSFTEYWLDLGADASIVINDEMIAALEKLPELG